MIYDTHTPCGPNPGLASPRGKLDSASPDSVRPFSFFLFLKEINWHKRVKYSRWDRRGVEGNMRLNAGIICCL